MATSMCRAWISRSIKICSRGISFSARRQLLSEAYGCRDAWQKRLESPILQNVSLSEFTLQLKERFDKETEASLIDMEIFANKLQEMDTAEVELVEDLLHRFRRSRAGSMTKESMVYAIVRAYIDLGLTDRLLHMMRDRSNYGIFPDYYSANILLDHFIKKQNFADGSKVAYEVMLQEDWGHPITLLLSLLTTSKHLHSSSLASLALEPPPEDTGEEEWVKVKVIPFPYYDDHFDIKDERFLLGKTLYMLGKNIEDNEVMSNSLKVIGLGLYQKFGKGLLLLDEIAASGKKAAIFDEALTRFDECIENAETRDPEQAEKEFGLRTIDDEIYKLRMTPDGKEELTTEFEEIAHKLRWNNQTSEDSLLPMVESMVTSKLSQYESADIDAQKKLFAVWEAERTQEVEEQLKLHLKQQRTEEIKLQLQQLQEKEELLNYFKQHDKILMAKQRAPREMTKTVEEDEDVLRAKRIKRRVYRHNI